jgi:hypothetical protein
MTRENKETTPAGKTFPDSMNREPMMNNSMPEMPANNEEQRLITVSKLKYSYHP